MRKSIQCLALAAFCCGVSAKAQHTFPVNGVHDEKHLYYAFVHAHIAVDYKTVLGDATLVVKDGLIESVGEKVQPPKGALVIDLKGKYLYPSLIDLYSDYGMPEVKKGARSEYPQFISNTKGAYDWNQAVKPEFNAFESFGNDSKKAEELRKLGFGAVQSFMRDGIARGTSVLVTLGDEQEHESILKERAASMLSFDKGSSTQDYPSSLMGSIALLRQTYLDGQWYKNTKKPKEYNISLESWNKNLDLPQIFECGDKLTELRADKVGDEFQQQYILKGAGDEYQRINEIKSTGAPLILGLNFPQAFDMDDPYEALQVSLAEMKHWEMAPSNSAVVEKAGITFAFTASDLKDKKDFWKNLRKAVEYGLSKEQALKALTYTPAELLKMNDKIGALKQGMLANFIVTSGDLFDKSTVIYENWVKGKQYRISEIGLVDIRGKYNLKIADKPPFLINIEGDMADPKVTADSSRGKLKLSRLGNAISLQLEEKGKEKGVVRLTGYADGKSLKGKGQAVTGEWVEWEATFSLPYQEKPKTDTSKKEQLSIGQLWFPNKEYGFEELPKAKTVLIKNVTIWTNEKEGIIKQGSVLLKDGHILSVNRDTSIEETPDMDVIDGRGKHLTAGIIDEHSHIAISRGVNEGTQAVTSEVRIGDVIDCDDIDIYRQLSGGVTASHLLHGSANPIGGQTTMIKLRWGLPPEALKVKDADPFIKFALGENVKQSNWGDRQVYRFPQTRMGVEQVYIDAFTRAKEYEKEWKRFDGISSTEKTAVSFPRRDLELDALVEILNNKRFITCHSYVQSELNMFMHVADSMGFKINTFTHILEGYKVADKMKARDIAASTFADWWAYKYEVMEAIPYNIDLLTRMKLITSVNSDDAEMGRRLNQEAAKSMKYGSLSEEEALKLCTLNPAKMLHLDNKMGSIRSGKDADIVLWSDNPLSVYAKVEKTFVDGICYYDSQRDALRREQIRKERARIAQKMIEAKKGGEGTQKPAKSTKEAFHCEQ